MPGSPWLLQSQGSCYLLFQIPLPLDAGIQLFTCFPSGGALPTAGFDAWLTVLQLGPLESNLPARIPLGLTRTFKGFLTPPTGLLDSYCLIPGVYCPVFPSREQKIMLLIPYLCGLPSPLHRLVFLSDTGYFRICLSLLILSLLSGIFRWFCAPARALQFRGFSLLLTRGC